MLYRWIHLLFVCAVVATMPLAPATAQEDSADTVAAENESPLFSDSGLPIPRFISLKFEEVNLRTGPGTRYPIRWVYKRKSMPVEVIEEFGQWRKLRDFQGDEGWAHQSQLSGSRSVVFTEDTVLKRYPENEAPPMIKVQKGIIAHVLECDAKWCEVQVESYKAWVQKHAVWGVYPRELI